MAPSDRPGSAPAPIQDDIESPVARDAFLVYLHPRQAFVRYESHRRRPHVRTIIPSQGHVDRLPGVATLLRRHNAMQFRGITTHTPTENLTQPSRLVDCWTPSQFAAGGGTPPDSRWRPLTNTCEASRSNNWSSSISNCHSLSDRADQSPAGTCRLDVRSPEPVRESSGPRTKSSRYLREIDRRRILMRIAQGEKQSALAKEYHVSRAAICNLNKHRAEVLSRNHEHPLAKHPKRRTVVKKSDNTENHQSTLSPSDR